MTTKKPGVRVVPLQDLVDDSRNANRGTERGASMLDRSLRELGAGRSLVVDSQGRIVAGNKTRRALIDAGFSEAVVVETDGQQAVVVKRTDWDLDDDQSPARRYAFYDNRVAELDLFNSAPSSSSRRDVSPIRSGDSSRRFTI